ncbi:ABC transporter permease [Chitinophaga filiformis]|uniref:FtsX-like permease family protein n=1 Tax=Chitinophaga filiformis TaxID=104663 RepID=A0A1G7NW48_CHIFI|nr:ABC transporter permease [Chitinophaga filiformis]SDF78173.1 FtsX-like permease family protein [Chitinophaga filiformis]
MIKNYTKLAWRNFRKYPLFSFINVAGLAIGLTCVLLVVLFVKNELSFDSFHKKAPQLYSITTTLTDSNGATSTGNGSGQVQGPAFKEAIPEIIDYVRFWNVGGFNIIGEEKAFQVQGLFADSSFFRLFSFPLLYGSAASALTDPHSIVLSEQTAMKYFGRTDVVGKTLKIEEQGMQTLTVTAVAKDIPSNSSIRFDVVLPFRFLESFFKDGSWLNQYLSTFVLLHPQADAKKVEQKFAGIFQAKADKEIQEASQREDISTKLSFGLEPFTGMHLKEGAVQSDAGIYDGSLYTALYLLSGIAAFILLMACINFVNLSIAHSLQRAKEIGIRKVNGSNRWQIIGQFLIEAALLCTAAFVLAIVFSIMLLPAVNSFTGRHIELHLIKDATIWILVLGILAISVIMTGLYPAFVLSGFNAAEVLYGKQKTRAGRRWLGKSLVVFQFTLAIVFVTGSLIYYLQMSFIGKKELGYNPSGVINIKLPPQRSPDQLVPLFRTALTALPSVVQVAGFNSWGDNNVVKVNDKTIISHKVRGDEFYLPNLGIQLQQGRNFSPAFGADSARSVIVNETFVKQAGWNDPIGQQVKLLGEWQGDMNMTVVGVMKDYHYNSLKQKIGPEVLVMKDYEQLLVKTKQGRSAEALAAIERIYKKYLSDSPFQFSFIDDDIARQYRDDKHWQQIIAYVTILSVFICCLGLFGLSYLAARQRTKEIGIRKVLGAGMAGIAGLLSKDFLQLVIIAFLIASPLSYFVMNHWLESFAYRINISWWIFLAAGVIAVFIAMATICFQTLRAAMTNPVQSLRSE